MKIHIAVLVACGLAPVASAQATFHGDNARSGVYPTAGPAKFGGIKWTFKASGPIVGSAAIAAGTVYFVSSAGALVALDLTTGKPLWVFVAGGC